jgi:hypothetical protein
MMPDWFAPLLAGIVLFAFLGYAFWRSRKVKRDRNNSDNIPVGAGGEGSGD